MVARDASMVATQLFQWKKVHSAGTLVAFCANGSDALTCKLIEPIKRIKQLDGALYKMTFENEILKEVVEYGKAGKWLARLPLLR